MGAHRVIKAFIDKETGKGYNEGSTFTSDDVERVTFLINKGYLLGEASTKKEEIDEKLLAEAKSLKVKGYTKMDEESLREAIDAAKAKKASESDGE